MRSPRAWRRQAGAARAGGAVVSIGGGCGGARAVLTKRPCAAACVRELRLRSSSAFSRSSRVHGPLGRRAASAWSRVRAPSALARRGGRRGHARRHRVRRRPGPCPCVVAADTALPQVSIRGRSRGSGVDSYTPHVGVWQQQQQINIPRQARVTAGHSRSCPTQTCSPLAAGEACPLPRIGSVSPSRAVSMSCSAIRNGRSLDAIRSVVEAQLCTNTVERSTLPASP